MPTETDNEKMKLFISYRRFDDPDAVTLIYDRLLKQLPRWTIFYDHKSMRPGEPFPERLQTEVTTANVVLVIIGPKWLEMLNERKDQRGPDNEPIVDHVREEVRLAIESGNNVVLPVLVGGASNLRRTDLKDFPEIQQLPVNNSRRLPTGEFFDAGFNALITFLDQIGPAEGPGSVLGGKYKLVRPVGEGGMGIVWFAKQNKPERDVAVKLVKRGMDSPQILARFDAERQAIAALDHPNIAKVFDTGATPAGRPYFVMEYIKGVPITEYCDANKLSPQRRLELFLQACDAIQHAHQKSIVHRDIKPGNVLVEEIQDKPICKVIDFGLAKAVGRSLTEMSLSTDPGTFVGTLVYASPEQAAGGATDIDTRSDVYSLGVLLYELLTGEPPFSKEKLLKDGDLAMRKLIVDGEPTRPSVKLSSSHSLPAIAKSRTIDPDKLTSILKVDLDWPVLKALAKERTHRFATPNELAAEIQRFLEGVPLLTHPPSMSYRVRKYVRKHRGFVTSVTAILTLLILGLIGISWYAIKADRLNSELSEQVTETKEARRKIGMEKKIAELLRIEAENDEARAKYLLGQSRLKSKGQLDAFVQFSGIKKPFRNIEWDLSQTQVFPESLTLYGHKSSVRRIQVSPDGKYAISWSADATLKCWDLYRGIEVWSKTADARSIAISFDSESVAYGSSQEAIACLQLNSGEVNWEKQMNTEVTSLASHPNQKKLLAGTQSGQMLVLSFDTAQIARTWTAHEFGVTQIAFSRSKEEVFSSGQDDEGAWTLKKWNAVADVPQLFDTLAASTGDAPHFALHPDGKRIVIRRDDGRLSLQLLSSAEDSQILGKKKDYPRNTSLSITPDGSLVLTKDISGEIGALYIGGEQDPFSISLFTSLATSVNDFALSPDGQWIATACDDSTVKLQMPFSGLRSRATFLEGHKDDISCIAFDANGKTVATGGDDKTIRIWNTENGRQLKVIATDSRVRSIKYSPTETLLISGDKDGEVAAWSTQTYNKIGPIGNHSAAISCLEISKSGQIASGGWDDLVRLWNPESGKETTLKGHTHVVLSLAFSNDSRLLATGGGDRRVIVWDLDAHDVGRPKWVVDDAHAQPVSSLAFVDGGRLVMSASDDGTLKYWDASNGSLTRIVGGKVGGKQFVTLPKKKRTAFLDYGVFSLGDTVTGELLYEERLPFSIGETVTASPNEDFLAICGGSPIAMLVDVEWYPSEIVELVGHGSTVTCLACTADNSTILTGSKDTSVRIWNVPEATQIGFLGHHSETVNDVTISKEGKLLASASDDNYAIVYDFATGTVLHRFWHKDDVMKIWFSSESDRLYTESRWFGKSVWKLESGAEPLTTDSAHWETDRHHCATELDNWKVILRGDFVFLIPDTCARRLQDRWFRRNLWEPVSILHEAQVTDQRQLTDPFPSLFHSAWALKAHRLNGSTDISMRVRDKFREDWKKWSESLSDQDYGREVVETPELLFPVSVRDVIREVTLSLNEE